MKQAFAIFKWMGISIALTLPLLCAAIAIAVVFKGQLATTDWNGVQAAGAILAIVGGFATILYQQGQQKADAKAAEAATGLAALYIANDALKAVAQRLDKALTPIGETPKLSLQGSRTTELVNAMREFDIARLPASVLVDYVQLRCHLIAINEWLTVVYADEDGLTGEEKERKRAKRHGRLESSVRIWRSSAEIIARFRTTVFSKYGRVLLEGWETSRIDVY